MNVRRAADGEIAGLVELSQRVQDALMAAGSLQEFGPVTLPVVAAHVAAGTAYVLTEDTRLLGGVFVAPVSSRQHKALAQWGLNDWAHPIWFLEKLMIEPAEQGRGLGDVLLAGVKQIAASHSPHPCIALDCWAGNATLRSFYERNGFRLYGVFPEGDYAVAVLVWSGD